MNTISSLERGIARLESCAAYRDDRARRCQQEATLVKDELPQEQSDTYPTLQELRELATTILELDGLTWAEIEAAEQVLADDSVLDSHAQRLRSIAANDSIYRWCFCT